ncbi:formate dehydrogenase delta subunit [Hoeflea halophila]|uniref:Formate dehydrogenase delta subunit n=1 Tax=Hoeflea halophila TaxID=714899 RepID=A0A286IFC9_9HYPH|nr:formate dehydrogenase subunit delta [Hoeflea halophila]SOE18772.1 formate dehydrogenase delta subunit [Hoeflea halophila]
MSPDKMRYQANQIATFFASQPEDEQVEGVADHINKFWDPRMRAKLFEMADESTEGFKPTLVAALQKINRPGQFGSVG